MNIAYIDMFSGISGDMTLGAFIDLGVPTSWLQEELLKILTGFELKTESVQRHHLNATDLLVVVNEEDNLSRNYSDIKMLIRQSSLPENVKKNSLSTFEKIAIAESNIHNTKIEQIHFHEIGGVDSIVDVIGSFLCVEYLKIEKVYASTVPLGSGFVDCSHGKLPVPVPATIAILKDIPVKQSDAKTEIVTPTGAAIVATLAHQFGAIPDMIVSKVGYGSGKRETGSKLPNLLRIVLGKKPEENSDEDCVVRKETIHIAKTNVDDMSPEFTGFLMEMLLESKALDVCFIPVQMKKNRPGIQIEVLCRNEDLDSIVTIILSQTTSIGVRCHECVRSYLLREKVVIDTSFGKLQVKKITNPDKSTRCVPEFEEVKKVAMETRTPLKDVYNQILTEANMRHRRHPEA